MLWPPSGRMATIPVSSPTSASARSASAPSTSKGPMRAEPPAPGGFSGTDDLPEPPEPRLRRRPRSADAEGAGDDRAGGLLLVHAHPDDESFSTGGLIARSVAEGRRVDLVTCTGGEECEIHDPELAP